MNCSLKLNAVMALLLLVSLISQGQTKLTSSWFDREAPPVHYKKIGVVALAADKNNRGLIESALAARMQENNLNGINTLGIFPRAGNLGEMEIDQEELKKTVEEKVKLRGLDALLIVALIDTEEDQFYVEGQTKEYTDEYYGGYGQPYAYPLNNYPSYGYSMHGYYSHYTTVVTKPGYYVNSRSYFLETSLFDAASGKLIWSAQSTVEDPYSIKRHVKIFANQVVDQLLKDKILK